MDKKERNQILKKAQQGKATLSHPTVKEYNDDKEIVMAVIGNYHGHEIMDASERLKKDRDVFMLAVKKTPEVLPHLPDEVRSDLEANILVLTHPFGEVEHLYPGIKETLNEREVALDAASINGNVLKILKDDFRDDKEIVMTAVNKNGMAYKGASKRLKMDIDVISASIENDDFSKNLMSDEIIKMYDDHKKESITLDSVVKSIKKEYNITDGKVQPVKVADKER